METTVTAYGVDTLGAPERRLSISKSAMESKRIYSLGVAIYAIHVTFFEHRFHTFG